MKVITITEDVIIPGTDVILEAGDSIRVLKEAAPKMRVNKDVSKRVGDLIDYLEMLADRYDNDNAGATYASAAKKAYRALISVNWERAPELR